MFRWITIWEGWIQRQSLSAFAKLRKAIVIFVISVRPSARMEQLCSHWTDFHKILYLTVFKKTVEKNSSVIEIRQKRVVYTKTTRHFWSYLSQFLQWEWSQTKVVEEIKTHILSSINFFFRKSCCLWGNVEKYNTVEQAADWQYDTCALHSGYLGLQMHTQVV